MADYARGLLRVDLATALIRPAPAADGVLTLGIDGLYRVGADLVGVQNGEWERFKDDGTIAAPAELQPPVVLRLPL